MQPSIKRAAWTGFAGVALLDASLLGCPDRITATFASDSTNALDPAQPTNEDDAGNTTGVADAGSNAGVAGREGGIVGMGREGSGSSAGGRGAGAGTTGAGGDGSAGGASGEDDAGGGTGEVGSAGGAPRAGGTESCGTDASRASVPDDLTALGSEFDVPGATSGFVDSVPSRHVRADVDAGGSLVLTPDPNVESNGWFNAERGPFLYQSITGNFVIEAAVRASLDSDPESDPIGRFANAGLLARDPGAAGGEAWIKYDVGAEHQDVGLGRAVKSTRESRSDLYMMRSPSSRSELRICRVENTFHFYRRDGDEPWQEELYSASTPQIIAEPAFVDGEPIRFERPDLPARLDVGVMAGFYDGSDDIRGTFDYVRMGRVESSCDCTRPLAPAPPPEPTPPEVPEQICPAEFCRDGDQRYVRVTDGVWPGNFAADATAGALAIADALCAADADASGNPELIARQWIAYLYADDMTPALRIRGERQWVTTDGAVVFPDTAAVHDPLGVHLSELGRGGLAWTGLTRTGNPKLSCANWAAVIPTGSVGRPDTELTSNDWRFADDVNCTAMHPLYCFESP